MSKLLKGGDLIARCEALGIDTMGEPQPMNEQRMRLGVLGLCGGCRLGGGL